MTVLLDADPRGWEAVARASASSRRQVRRREVGRATLGLSSRGCGPGQIQSLKKVLH